VDFVSITLFLSRTLEREREREREILVEDLEEDTLAPAVISWRLCGLSVLPQILGSMFPGRENCAC
jgi:hypothetical protein